jgi:flagellar hook assembly protein FlgD
LEIPVHKTPSKTFLSSVISTAIATAFVFAAPAQADVRFYPVVNLANNTGLSFSPDIAVGPENNVYVAWYDNTSGGTEILFSRSTDAGTTFNAPKNVSNNLGYSTFPSVIVGQNGTVHVSWQDTEYGASEIVYAKSTDGGLTFSTPVNVSNDEAASVKVDMVMDAAGVLWMVWSDDSAMWLAKSTDGGNTFSKQAVVSAAAGKAPIGPKITIAGGTMHLTYQQSISLDLTHIMYLRSTDGGASFSTPVALTAVAGEATLPSVAADNAGNVYVAWQLRQGDERDVHMARSSDFGATFSASSNITNNSGISIGADLFVDAAGTLYMVWQDTTPGNYEAMFMKSTDHGASFGPQLNIAPSLLGSLITRGAVDTQGNIFAAWDDNRFGTFDPIVAAGREGLPAIDDATATPNPFSPNGDGISDTTTISATFTEELKWQLDILDGSNRALSVTRGTSTSLSQVWNGKDKRGRVAPDGTYKYKITGTKGDGTRAVPAEGTIKLSTVSNDVPPSLDDFVVDPTTFGPDGDGRRETISVRAVMNRALDWSISYQTMAGVELFSQNGNGFEVDVEWDGKDYSGVWQPNGEYTVNFTAVDDIGRTVTAQQVIKIDTVAPEISNITFTPSTFSPDGDGIDDSTTLSFTLSNEALVTVYIYESGGGTLVRELYRLPWYNSNPEQISMVWDGKSGTGVKVPAGKYNFKIWARDYAANKAPQYPYTSAVNVK